MRAIEADTPAATENGSKVAEARKRLADAFEMEPWLLNRSTVEYRFVHDPTQVAFVANGRRLETTLTRVDVVGGMLDAIEARAEGTVTIKQGSREFAQIVIEEANKRGMRVLNRNGRELTPTKTLNAVIDAVAASRASSVEQRERLKQALRTGYSERVAGGQTPKVDVYDHRAPRGKPRDIRTVEVHRTRDRSRER